MAHRKRSRDIDDIDGEVEVESASSSFRQYVTGKRSRIALARENGGSVVSDDEESDIDDLMADDTQDNVLGSDDDDDDIYLRGTQVVAKQFREHRENIAMEQGVIEEVFCRNFMCHSKLRIKLGPLINFIIGHNGSGKSAVLTALTMCLGGKASATNRGSSLKSFIKEGEDSATLAVKIKNRGEGAYKPDIYGRSIIVERHFTRAGTSGFKLKNEREKVISTKKSDLDDIIDFYAFQLDNPINVLTQDMARQFLSNSTPGDKYKFFIRGTQLEALDADYKIMEEHLDNIELRLSTREHDIAALKQKMDEAESRKKRLEQMESTREKVNRLRWQHAWAQVEEMEKALTSLNADVEAAVRKVQEMTEAAEQAEGAFEGHNQTYEAHRHTLHTFQEQLRPAAEAQREAKEVMDAAKAEMMNVLAQQRECKEEIQKLRKTIERIENDIHKENELLASAEGAEHIERLAKLEELKADHQSLKAQQDEHEKSYGDLKAQQADAARAAEEAKRPVDQCSDVLKQAEARLRNLQQNQGRQWAAYRPHMEDLVRAINRETRWRQKPVGPMASHIRLLKPEWSSQIEKTLGGNGDAFLVTNKEDQDMLSQLMKRVNCQCGVFIGSAARLDITGRTPTDDVDTLLSVLEIDNDLVRNSLIINQAAEQIALIADNEEATKFMFRNPRPQNVRATMAISSDRRGGFRHEYSGRGAEKTTSIYPWEGGARMKTDIQDQIRMAKEAINRATQELEAARATHRRSVEAQKEVHAALKAYDRRALDFRREVQQAEDRVIEQQNIIEAHRPQDGKLQELEKQLQEEKETLETQTQSYQDMVNAKDDKHQQMQEAKAVLDAAEADLARANKNVEKAEHRLKKVEGDRRQALMDKNMAINLIENAKQEQAAAEEARDHQQEIVETYTSQALTISQRVEVPPDQTPAMLDERIERLLRDIGRAEREAGGTKDEVLEAWMQARQEHAEAEGQVGGMKRFKETLKDTLSERKRRWQKFRQYIAARARITFQYLLSERQFRGNVLMDHRRKLLDIKVEPDLSKRSDAGRATKTLSGGEKSFSTICLLLSIWEAMGSPIRCLDEFDVFMDSVNRATSMGMMIGAARRSSGRQFILITPQAMGNVTLGDDVKVHKMSDPERGQTTLPYN